MENHLLIMLLAVVAATTAIPPLLDLSRTYNLDPGASHKVVVLEKGMNRIYIAVKLNQMCSSSHTGTHLEAPITFQNSSWSVDNIPYERLWRVPGVVMDVSPFMYSNYELTAEVLQTWEDRTQLFIPDGGILLIRTGFEPMDKISEDDDGNEARNPQPRLSEDAGQWLANYGPLHGHDIGIVGVGIDLNSLDGHDTNISTSARAILYEKNIYALHNLKNLHMLPKSGFLVTVMPMKIFNGAGAPARVLAEREDMRPVPSVDGSMKEYDADWHSEKDYPRWDMPDEYYGVVKASGIADRCHFNLLVIGLPIVLVVLGLL